MARLLPRLLTYPALFAMALAAAHAVSSLDAAPSYRFEKAGWTYVHLEGSPAEIGFQHGQLLSAEIADMVRVIRLENEHATKRNWEFFRQAGRTMLWPHIDAEYQQELEGIARGAQSKGVKLDVWDIVALNGGIELPQYYVPWVDKRQHTPATVRTFFPRAAARLSSPLAATRRAARSSLRTTTGPVMQRVRAGP